MQAEVGLSLFDYQDDTRSNKHKIIFPVEKFLSIITNSLCSMVSELYVTQTYFLSDSLYKQYTFGKKIQLFKPSQKEALKTQPAPVTPYPVRHNQQYTCPPLTSRSNTLLSIDGPIAIVVQYFHQSHPVYKVQAHRCS